MFRASSLVFLMALSTGLFGAQADLSAALRRSKASAASTPSLPAPAGPVAVPLRKVSARGAGNAKGGFFIADIEAGTPAQKLSVLFDTGSTNVILPHRACRSVACKEHKRYSAWESQTSTDVNMDGRAVIHGERLILRKRVSRDAAVIGFTQADLGDGNVTAVTVRDTFCIGGELDGQACVRLDLLGAVKMDEVPFRAMPNDGIVGLGFETMGAGNPRQSFFASLLRNSGGRLQPQFGLSLGETSGEIYFGGQDTTRIAGPITWLPVDHPEAGYWQMDILAVRVGNVTVDSCQRGCHGIIDTGASRLGVQAPRLPHVAAALASSLSMSGGACHGPELVFELKGMALTLPSRVYADETCAPDLGPLQLDEVTFVGVYAFGHAVLQNYYTAFDWATKQVGFAPVAERGTDGPADLPSFV